MIHWDANKYPGATVYFEAVFLRSGPGETFTALFNSAGAQVANSYLMNDSCGGWNYCRFRSPALTLTDDTDYTVRVAANGLTVGLKSAKLIVVQSDATKITTTSSQVEVGAAQTFTNTDYTAMTSPKYYQYDAGKFSPTVEASGDVAFSATVKIADAADTVFAELYNRTNSTSVAEVSYTGGTAWTLQTVTNVDGDADWDTSNDDEYEVRIKCTDGNGGGCSGSIANAKIILDQSDVNGITATEILHEQVNALATDADSTYSSQSYLSRFNPEIESTQVSFAGGAFNYSYEATMKTTAGTAYAQLYSPTNAAAIAGSEITTTNAEYTRVRSGDLTANMPSFPSQDRVPDLDTQIKNSAANTTSVSNSWLVIQVSNLSTTGSPTAYADLYNLTDNAVVSNSEVSTSASSWSRQRSSSISLTTGKEYVVRTRSSVSNVPMFMANAKIILDQSDVNGIVATEAIVPLSTIPSSDADNTYTGQSGLLNYDPNVYERDYFQDIYLESTMKTTAGTGYIQLYNVSNASAVAASETTTTASDYTRKRSTTLLNFMPISVVNLDYQLKNSATNTTTVSNASLLLNLNSAIIPAYDGTMNYVGNIQGPTWKQSDECSAQRCLSFDGVNDYVDVQDKPAFDFTVTGDFSISGWIRTASTSGTIISKYNANTGTDGGYKIYLSSGKVAVGFDTNNTSFPEDSATSVNSVNDNKWHHIAVTKQGTTQVKLYIDGKLESTDSSLAGSGTYANTDLLTIGIDSDRQSNPLSASLDEMAIYPYVLSDQQIMHEASRGNVLGASTNSLLSNLVAHWKLDETSGPAVDSSGNGNNATWNGNSAAVLGKFKNAISLDGDGDFIIYNSANGIPTSWRDINISWHIDGWNNRKAITLANTSGSTLTNYQVAISFTPTSAMQADLDDLRFTNASGTLLNYWIETANSPAIVWVKVDSIPTTGATIYMYYGNGGAVSASNGANTFIFFDDASGTYANNWVNSEGAGSYTTVGGKQAISLNSSTTNIRTATFQQSGAFTLDADIYATGVITAIQYYQDSSPSTNERYHARIDVRGGDNEGLIRDGGVISSLANPANSASTWYPVTIKVSPAGLHTWTVNSTLAASVTDTTYTSGYLALNHHNSGTGAVANLRVRSYAAAEPTTSFGNEESQGRLTSMTLSAWVNASTLDAANRVIIARNNSEAYSWAIYTDSASPGKLKFTSDGVNVGTSNTTLSTGSWYHVTMAIEGLTTKLYINGAIDITIANNGMFPGAGDIAIGADPDGTNGWHGLIDDVRIYNRTLAAKEIDQLYRSLPGTIASYDLNENIGTVAYDRSGNNHHLTVDGPTWTTGKYGAGLSFNGIDDNLTRTDTDMLDVLTSGSISIEAWFKHAPLISGIDMITAKGDLVATGGYKLYMNSDGTITCGFDRDGIAFPEDSAVSTASYNDSQWHHVVCVKDGTASLSLYVDSIKVGTDTSLASTGTYENASPLYIGIDADGLTNQWQGQLDEIKFYDYAVTPEKRVSSMNADHPIGGSPIGSPLIHYDLDEASGATAHNTGNGSTSFNGTITNGSWSIQGKIGSAITFASNTGITATISDPGNTNALSVWLYPTASIANKTLVTAGKLTTDGSGRPVYGGCAGTALPLNQWTHLVAISNGSSCQIYQNGSPTALGGTGVTFGTSLDLGSSSYTGMMDDFKLYTTPLTPEQIAIDMHQGASVVLGTVSTSSNGQALTSKSIEYCVPGSEETCNPPVAEWKFNEKTGSTTNDSSGNAVVGSWGGTGTHWANGKSGAAGKFNGTDDKVTATSNLYAISNALTMEAWIYPTSLTGARDILANVNTWDYRIAYVDNDLVLQVSLDDGNTGYHAANDVLTLNTWQHITATFDGSRAKIYLNGSMILDEAAVGSVQTPGNGLVIGSYGGGEFYQGLLDDVRLYNYARTAAQVAWDYNQGQPIVWYDMDECSGTTIHSRVKTANGGDSGLNGTIAIGGTGTYTAAGSCSSDIATESWNAGTTGKNGASLAFDGSDDFVDIGTGPTTVNAVSFWIKPTTTTEYPLDLNGTAYIWLNAGTVTAQGFTTPIIYVNGAAANTITAGVWQQVTVVTNSGLNATDLDIGRIEGVGYMEGQLDEVRLYNYSLTPTQIQTLYAGGAAVFQ